MERNDSTEEQTEKEELIPITRKVSGSLKLRTDIFKEGVVNGATHKSPSPPIKLSRNFTPPEVVDSGFWDFSGFSMESPEPLILVKEEEEEEGEMEVDTNLSSSSGVGTSLSSEGFPSFSSTSTPRKSAEKINSEDGEDLRKTLARKRKSDSDDKDMNEISVLSQRIEKKQETIREIERISQMKIAQIEEEIAADKSEMERIRKVEVGGQNKRKKIELQVKSGNPSRFSEYCELCDVKAKVKAVWKAHLQGRRHQESLKRERGYEGERDLRGWLTRK